MSQPTQPDGARPSPVPAEGIAAKRPPRKLSPNVMAARAHQVAASDEPVEIKEGTLIGDYSVQRRLDEGGMGTVYSAVHPVIGKKVAIKVLHPHVARQEEAVARFIQEARAVNAIGHPGIVDIFGFGRFVDGRHYITMEYLEGQQLLAYLNARGPIPALDVLPLARQLAESLAAAHDKGVVHRDMKPENVFLGVAPGKKKHEPWPPRTKILDFGLAKLIEAEFSDRKPRTRAGVTVGTPYYMSPEQCRGKAIDRRADVYALGVMMYEMVTGRVPFYAAESVDVLYMHLTQEPEAPSSHRPVPEQIERLILRCMAKLPEDRPQNMHELMAELDAVMAELMPGEVVDRPDHELLQEAEAFFGGAADLPAGSPPEPEPRTPEKNRITLPMSAEGLPVPDEGSPPSSAPSPKSAPPAAAEPGVAVGTEVDLVSASRADPDAPDGEAAGGAPPQVKTFSKPAGQGVPSLPTPVPGSDVVGVSTRDERDEPTDVVVPRPAALSKPPALNGFKTAITAIPGKYRPRQRGLLAGVITLGAAVVVLAAMLLFGPHGRPAPTPKAAAGEVDLGSVELVSPTPVDVYLEGQPLARRVRRILITRLPAGTTQLFVLKRPDGSVHRARVRVAVGRTVTVTIPAPN